MSDDFEDTPFAILCIMCPSGNFPGIFLIQCVNDRVLCHSNFLFQFGRHGAGRVGIIPVRPMYASTGAVVTSTMPHGASPRKGLD